MQWYVSVDGQPSGPIAEEEVVDLVRSGRQDLFVRGEAGGPWLPISQSPFAGYAPPPASLKPAYSQALPVQPAKPGMGFGQQLAIVTFVFGGLILLLLGTIYGWFGTLLGLGLIAWAVVAHQKGRRSLLSFVFRARAGLLMSGGLLALGLLFSTCGVTSVMRARARDKAEEKRLVDEQLRADTQAEELASQLAAVPSKIQAWKAKVAAANTTAKGGDPVKGHRDASAVWVEVNKTRLSLGASAPPELISAEKEILADITNLKEYAEVALGCTKVQSNIDAGKELAKVRDWVRADDLYDGAIATLLTLDAASEEGKKFIPAGFDVGKKRAEIKQLKRLIAAPVARERKRIEKEEAEKATAEAYVEICGPAPSNVTFGLTNALKKTAHDPDSIEVTTCTTPAMTKKNCWVFDCGVRGTNMLGAKVFQTRTFRYSRLLGYQEDK